MTATGTWPEARGYIYGFATTVVLVDTKTNAALIVDASEKGEAQRIEDIFVLEAFLVTPHAHDVVQGEVAVDQHGEIVGGMVK